MKLIEIILDFIARNDGLEIVFRAHPLERPNAEIRYQKLIASGVNMSAIDLYDDILKCDLVFGEFSTALYEAMAFNKKVIILENKYSRQYISKMDALNVLEHVESAEELHIIVTKTKKSKMKPALNTVWAKDWRKNYDGFLKVIWNDNK